MIKVLADKVLAFDRGEKDGDGQVVRVTTKIGFCELPDWVAETDYFKLATLDGSVKSFISSRDDEAVLKDQEKAAALKAEIAALEEQRDLLIATAAENAGATVESTDTSPTDGDGTASGTDGGKKSAKTKG